MLDGHSHYSQQIHPIWFAWLSAIILVRFMMRERLCISRILSVTINNSRPSQWSNLNTFDILKVHHRCTSLPVLGTRAKFEKPFHLEVAVYTACKVKYAVQIVCRSRRNHDCATVTARCDRGCYCWYIISRGWSSRFRGTCWCASIEYARWVW